MEEEEVDEGEVTRMNDHSMKRLEDDLEVSLFIFFPLLSDARNIFL